MTAPKKTAGTNTKPAKPTPKRTMPERTTPKKAMPENAMPATRQPQKPKRDIIAVGPAKGRPMLSWVGKRPLRNVTAFPAQEIERFVVEAPLSSAVDWSEWPSRYPRSGLLFHGDNKEVLAHLLANGFRGKVDLIYIDPPFDSGADYVRRVELRGAVGTARLDGQGYTLGEQIQYTDIWANDNYLQFMYERLLLIRELVGTGAVYVHSDARRVHHLRALLDEVFGEDAFRNQIVWRRTSSHGGANRFGAVTDHILFYTRGENVWSPQFSSDVTRASGQTLSAHRPAWSVRAWRAYGSWTPSWPHRRCMARVQRFESWSTLVQCARGPRPP